MIIDKEGLLLEISVLTLDELRDDYISVVLSHQEVWQEVLKEARKYGDEDMFGVYPIGLFRAISEAMEVLGE